MGFCTYYSVKNNSGEIVIDNLNRSAVCFSEAFKLLNEKHNNFEYTIKVCKTEVLQDRNLNNRCYLNQQEIIKLLKVLRRYVKISKISVEDIEGFFHIHFTLNNGTRSEHKFALTFMRLFYEKPYNLMAKDVLYLIENNKNEGLSFINLFSAMLNYWTSKNETGPGHMWIHHYYYALSYTSYKEIKERLKNNKSLNELLNYDMHSKFHKPQTYEIDNINKRVQCYYNFYSLVKKKK